MIKALTPLPIRVLPIDGESLASFLDRISATLPYAISLATLYYNLGLQATEKWSDAQSVTGAALTCEQLHNASFTLRLPEERLRAMLLTHYDGVAVAFGQIDLNDPDQVRNAGRTQWVSLVGSHYCPACLAGDQAWRLAWKLPFSFACTRHASLLNDTCPECGRRAGNVRTDWGGGPVYAIKRRQPGHCMNPPARGQADAGRNARSCGHDLTTVPGEDLQHAARLLATQARIDTALETRHDAVSGLPALAFFQALRSLCSLLLYIAEPEDLGELPPTVLEAARQYVEERQRRLDERKSVRTPGGGRSGPVMRIYGSTPISAALMAALLPWATETLTPVQVGCLCRQDLSERLRPLVERLRSRGQGHLRMVAKDFAFQGTLLEAFHAVLSEDAGFDHRLGQHSIYAPAGGTYTFTDNHVPPLLWADEYHAHFAPLFAETDMREQNLRAFCSAALVRLCGVQEWVDACVVLGLPDTYARGTCNKAVGILGRSGHDEAFARALHDLAARLEAQPDRANYRRRREALSDLRVVPVSASQAQQWAAAGGTPATLSRNHHAAVFIWEQVTGSDWRLAPFIRDHRSPSARELYMRFATSDLKTLRPYLLEQAAALAAEVDPGCGRLVTGVETL